MRMRVFFLVAALAAGGVAWAEVRVGEVRSTQAKAGVAMRETPRTLGKVLQSLAYGTRVTVVEVSGYFAKVRTDEGTEGWVRAADLVEPGALTQGGAGAVAGARDVSSTDVSAAGRQFDEGTEGRYKAESAELDRAYGILDALEKKSLSPDSPEVIAFVRDGRLGREPR
jgi:uncharacterized protein YgiM (DUF1202 family)